MAHSSNNSFILTETTLYVLNDNKTKVAGLTQHSGVDLRMFLRIIYISTKNFLLLISSNPPTYN
jgi:hypothetical protein